MGLCERPILINFAWGGEAVGGVGAGEELRSLALPGRGAYPDLGYFEGH